MNKVLDTYPRTEDLSDLAARQLSAFESARADLFSLAATGHSFHFTIVRRLEALDFGYPPVADADRLSMALFIVDACQQMKLIADTRDMVSDHIVACTAEIRGLP